MSNTNMSEYNEISKVVQYYVDGAVSGSSGVMKKAFHEDATIFGYIGDDLFAGPIQKLYDWNDANGAATGLIAKVVSIDVIGSVARVRVESDNWTGHRFSDFFNLLKVDGQWKIMNKVFYLHS
jgi:hypothetical protein